MPDFVARCDLLTRENDDLRERVAQLEEALGLTADIPPILGLTPTEGQMLGLLSARGFVRKEAFMTVLYALRSDADNIPDDKIVDVLICKLRSKLEPWGIQIDTKWGEGWFLANDGKKRARELLGKAAA